MPGLATPPSSVSNCAAIEPTDRWSMAALGERLILLVDTYEAFHISDAWFGRISCPRCLRARTWSWPAGRPALAWFGALGWSGGLPPWRSDRGVTMTWPSSCAAAVSRRSRRGAFTLLRYLMQRDGRAISRAELLQDVWGYVDTGDSNVVEAAVRALRRTLAPRARVIETVRGTGYRYRAER